MEVLAQKGHGTFVVIFFLILSAQVQCANILFIHLLSSYSHKVVTYSLAEELVNKGHQVSYISPFLPRGDANPSIKEVVPKSVETIVNTYFNVELDINLRVTKQLPPITDFYLLGVLLCESFLTSPELKEYLASTEKVDLIIMDNCLSECALPLVHKFQAKQIHFSTIVQIGHEYDKYGFLPDSSGIPEIDDSPSKSPMTFWERTVNSLNSLRFSYVYSQYNNAIDDLIRKHGNVPDMPHVSIMAREANLVFYTGDIVTDFPRSHPPLVVNVAGLHLKNTTKPVPKDIETFLKAGTDYDGIVYISLGSLVVSSNLPADIKQVFFDTISEFPRLKFLWKWNGAIPKTIPKNLFLSKWFPQVDILAHPKMKAFVTQCGRPSTLESLYNAVPMIAFPVIQEQDYNCNRMNKVGGNVILELGTLTHAEFKGAIEIVALNPEMKQQMTKLRKIFLDRPMPPLETAVWWTEYVLRQDDTLHLRSESFDQQWFERRLLDVWAFLVTAILVILLVLIYICMLITKTIHKIFRSSSFPGTSKSSKEKNKSQ